jgi:hypothetical protein
MKGLTFHLGLVMLKWTNCLLSNLMIEDLKERALTGV